MPCLAKADIASRATAPPCHPHGAGEPRDRKPNGQDGTHTAEHRSEPFRYRQERPVDHHEAGEWPQPCLISRDYNCQNIFDYWHGVMIVHGDMTM